MAKIYTLFRTYAVGNKDLVSLFGWLSSIRNSGGERSIIWSFLHCFEIIKLIYTKIIGIAVYFSGEWWPMATTHWIMD